MPDVLWFNGRFTTTDERVISVEDRGFQFGDGVYEVLKFMNRRPLFAGDHFARMTAGLGELEIPVPWNASAFDAMLAELIARTEFAEGIVYIQVTRGVAERTHFYPEDLEPTALVYTRRWNFPSAAKKRSGIAAITTPDIRWTLCRVKSVNLLGNVLTKKRAQRAKADEALLVRDGCLIEGASSSFFGVRDGVVTTHPAHEGMLPGTVCDRVLDLARKAGIVVREEPIPVADMANLHEAFVTSTTQGVMPVTTIDGVRVGDGTRGAVTERLQVMFDELERAEAGQS